METVKPLIQDVTSQRTASHSPQAETVPPVSTPIKTTSFHQYNYEEFSSNFETVVLSQLSLIVQITQSLG